MRGHIIVRAKQLIINLYILPVEMWLLITQSLRPEDWIPKQCKKYEWIWNNNLTTRLPRWLWNKITQTCNLLRSVLFRVLLRPSDLVLLHLREEKFKRPSKWLINDFQPGNLFKLTTGCLTSSVRDEFNWFCSMFDPQCPYSTRRAVKCTRHLHSRRCYLT